MDLRDQLKNLFPDHVEQDFQIPEEQHEQREPLICKYEKKGRNGKPVTLIEGFEGSEEELKNYSEEDLKKFLDGDALKQMQEAHARMVDNNLGSGKGQVEVGLLEMYNASKIEFNDGKAWEHGLVQLRVCENWSGVRNADGSKSIPDDKAKRTMDTIIERHADGYYYLVSYRVDHYGCD